MAQGKPTARRMMALTAQMRRCKDFIREFDTANGMMPSYREVCEGLGLSSTAAAHRLIACLEDRGHLERLPGKARAMALIEEHGSTITVTIKADGGYSVDAPQGCEVRVVFEGE